jgi:hypothetical protein
MNNPMTRVYSNILHATSAYVLANHHAGTTPTFRFLNGIYSERRGWMFNKNVVYLSPFTFPSIKWGSIMWFLVTPHHMCMFKLRWRLCSTFQSHHRCCRVLAFTCLRFVNVTSPVKRKFWEKIWSVLICCSVLRPLIEHESENRSQAVSGVTIYDWGETCVV